MSDTPANPTVRPAEMIQPAARKRISMTAPQRALEAPEIPGYHLYWFLGKNVPRALQGGYEFVDRVDVGDLNQKGVANDIAQSGDTGMGSRVTVVTGAGENGQPEHLVLMKIREEWYREDQKILEERNAQIYHALRQKKPQLAKGEPATDANVLYANSTLETHTIKRRPVNG